jgi:hypothetical protein
MMESTKACRRRKRRKHLATRHATDEIQVVK